MNSQRILVGVAWTVSVIAAYFIGGTAGQPGVSQQGAQGSGSSAGAHHAPADTKQDRTYLRTADELAQQQDTARPNIATLIAKARLEMSGGMGGMMNIRGMLRGIAPIAELDDSQVQEALAEVERTIKEPQQKMMFYSLLLGQWAESDGKAAIAYAEEKMGGQGPFDMGIRAAVLGSWARKDPDAAWRWFQTERKDEGGEQSKQMSLNVLFAGMAANNLDSALQRLQGLDEPSMAMALNGIAGSASDDASRRRLLDRAAGMPAELRQKIQNPIASQWVMTDPEGAMKWIRSLPKEDQKGVRENAGSMMLMMRPAVAADFMLEGVEEKEKGRIYDRVAGQWAHQDAKAAGEWLTKQPQGPELDGARRTYSMIVASKDPAAAMDWAKSVQNEDQRGESISQIFLTWRIRDAAAAEAALDASGLPAEKVKQLKDTKPPLKSPPDRPPCI